jgi:hypothetical protein
MKTSENESQNVQKRLSAPAGQVVIHIDVGDKSPAEALAIIQRWKTILKKASS